MHRPVAWALALLLIVPACSAKRAQRGPPDSSVRFDPSQGGAAELSVWVADTFDERQKGLSGVDRLSEDEGMAFVFPQPTADTFWMKDTLIPLSVAFVLPDGTVGAIREMVPCLADPCRTYASPEPYTLAVEANPQWFSAHHVVAGSSATLKGVSPG
ncbi:MAG: DUF192 domain-containing protein [Actinomycetota bacterium]